MPRRAALISILPLVLAGVAAAPARAQLTVTPYEPQSCVAPGGQVTLGGTATATSTLTNAHALICCPPGTTFGSPSTSETGGAPSMSFCQTGFADCQYVNSPTAPLDGVGVQCNGSGTWPGGATETFRIPVTVSTAAAPGSTLSCKLDFFSASSSGGGTQFLVLAVDQTCNTPPPTPTIVKKVVDPDDWFLGRFGGVDSLAAFLTDLVCYEITWRGTGAVTDSLPRDFSLESCTPSDRRAYYCHYDPTSGELFVHEQSGLPFSPSNGKVTVCGRFTQTHPAPGVGNVAVLIAAGGTRYSSNTATVVVKPLPSGFTPPQLPPASVVTPAASPTTLNAPVQRASSSAATSAASFAWLSSDVDAAPAALGATLTKTFPAPGQYTVTELETVNGFTAFRDIPVTVTAAAAGCHADADTLCLGANGRFRVQVDWQDLPNQKNGVANAHPITADTGAFWFFDSSNLELVVKVLDGTLLNQHYWVFYGALSNVQYEIKVTDTQTGTVRTYTNPQGTQASASDTVAFAASAADQADAGDLPPGREPTGDLTALAAPEQTSSPTIACTTGGGNLCLDGRFLVTVAWNDVPNHRTGAGTAVSLTSTSGYDWFFSDTNIELIMKIVDGRGLNGHFWFFYGALSNVQYTITVTDTQTGAQKTYNNPQGTQASRADTSAF